MNRKKTRKLDELNKTLLFIGAAAFLTGNLLNPGCAARRVCAIIALVLLLFFLLRTFTFGSVETFRQNRAFVKRVRAVQSFLIRRIAGKEDERKELPAPRQRMAERALYKTFRCPDCGQKLRVPRAKGLLRVTCPNCGKRFEIRS